MIRDLPPALQLVASEKLWAAESPDDVKKRLENSGLRKELARQAQWTLERYNYTPPDQGGFVASPSGSLNPFSKAFKCGTRSCRLQSAEDFVKTVALYVDHVVAPDPFTSVFAGEKINYFDLFSLLSVYRYILPIVQEGIFTFTSPVHYSCRRCAGRIDESMGAAVARILDEASTDFQVELREDLSLLIVHCPELFAGSQHPLSVGLVISKNDLARLRSKGWTRGRYLKNFTRPLLIRHVKETARNTLFEMSTAQEVGATVLASSRAELLYVAAIADSRVSLRGIDRWEAERSIELPWIHELTPAECLVLRREARTALPQLRFMLMSRLQSGSTIPTDVSSLVAELRAQTAEVEEEIRSIAKLGEGRYRLAVSGFGLAFVLYGLASGVPAIAGAGLTGLLASLAHAQAGARRMVEKKVKIESAPAYALVKARQILTRRQRRR